MSGMPLDNLSMCIDIVEKHWDNFREISNSRALRWSIWAALPYKQERNKKTPIDKYRGTGQGIEWSMLKTSMIRRRTQRQKTAGCSSIL